MNNRIKIKSIIAAMLLISLIIGVCGCMSEAEREVKKKEQEETVKEQVLQEMRNRYNEEFTFTGSGTENWNASYQEIYVRSESHPEKSIMIRRDGETGEMTDNYLTYYLAEDVEAIFNPMVREIYPESKVIYDGLDSPMLGLTPDMTAQEMVDYLNEWTSLYMTICVYDPDYMVNKDVDLEKLRKSFQEKGYRVGFEVFYMLEGKLDVVERKDKNDLYTGITAYKWVEMRGDFYMDDSYEFLNEGWRKIER